MEKVPEIGDIVGYQVMWASAGARWETVSELEYYRALHQEAALCFGRLLRVAPDITLTNEDHAIHPLPVGVDAHDEAAKGFNPLNDGR